jgi:hypothetical protein
VDAREAWADDNRSAVCSHHRGAEYKYTVLRDRLSCASITAMWLKAGAGAGAFSSRPVPVHAIPSGWS